ncbi:MAG: hypothetical protein M3N38_05485 [Pseudomonadota bacterium]|nr:hypothetical protein [Pseudomonadota bacterium]
MSAKLTTVVSGAQSATSLTVGNTDLSADGEPAENAATPMQKQSASERKPLSPDLQEFMHMLTSLEHRLRRTDQDGT